MHWMCWTRMVMARSKPQSLAHLKKDLRAPKSEDELQKLHTETDIDKGGTIYAYDVLATQMRDYKDELLEAFKVFDKNNDGFIATEEMKQIMGNLGQKITDQELSRRNYKGKRGHGKHRLSR